MIKIGVGLDGAWRQVRRLPTTAREAGVLVRAGLAPVACPQDVAHSLLAVRRWGMVAGSLRIAARRDPDHPGLVDERGELSFAELDRRSTALAWAWRERGLDHRSTIAVLCRDHRGLVESMAAAGKLGAALLLMNTGFARPQFAQVAEREGIDALVLDEEFEDVLGAVADSVPRVLAWVERDDPPHETLEQLIAAAPERPRLPPPASIGSLVLLTSGTTGTPKGAPRQVSSPFAAAQFLDRIPLRLHQHTLFGAPLFHATGFSQFVLTLALGSTAVLRRRFDPRATLRLMERYRCEAVVLVPTMLQRILQLGDEEIARHDTSALRILFLAGSALSPELGNHATRLFGDVVYNLYGSTEVAVASVATPADWRRAPGTVGRPPVGCTVRLYDRDGRRVTAPDVTARVFVGSGLGFAGYTGGGSKEEIDGLLSSGDVGHVDRHGLLLIDGRDDDMIVSGGENVYPAEVENLLLAHPAVADAAVVGVPDADFGQRLKALIVPREGRSLTEDEVKDHVRAQLARHKVPRDVQFVTDLPRNTTGKLLRDRLAAEHGDEPAGPA